MFTQHDRMSVGEVCFVVRVRSVVVVSAKARRLAKDACQGNVNTPPPTAPVVPTLSTLDRCRSAVPGGFWRAIALINPLVSHVQLPDLADRTVPNNERHPPDHQCAMTQLLQRYRVTKINAGRFMVG